MPADRHSICAVLGAGAWGATLADLLARKGLAVHLWDHSPEALDRLAVDGAPFGVEELDLSSSVRLVADLGEALSGVGAVFLVVPSQAVAGVTGRIADHLDDEGGGPVVVLASKGIDLESRRLLSDVAAEALPRCPIGVLSGPCIAREVAQGVPTSVVAASVDIARARHIRDLVATPRMRAYAQTDVRGVELGGALKNVIAIAAGIGDGLGFGANSKSALVTRGLAEMARLMVAHGAARETVYGLAGVGDLAVTCFSPHSRNRTFGEHLGKGRSADEAREAIGMTVEGEPTARAALEIGRGHGLELPITEVVVAVCEGRLAPADAVDSLMRRELKDEFSRGDRPPGQD